MNHTSTASGLAELVVLDVGHGNAAVIHEGDVSLLIDAAAGSHVLEYLKHRAISELALVVLSHSDQDHIGGLMALLGAGIRVRSVRLNADSEKESELWRDLVFSLEDARRRGELEFNIGLASGALSVQGLQWCRAEIVGPTPALAALGAGAKDRHDRRITSNSISASIRVHYKERPICLLTGDMDVIGLDDLVDAQADMRAPILVFPHHGGLPGDRDVADFTRRLLASVGAQTVVFSNGRQRHDNPRPEIVATVLKSNANAYVACTQLSARCAEKQNATPPTHLNQIFSAGASRNSCCAGSIVVDLAQFGVPEKFRAAHVAFISQNVPTPLCAVNAQGSRPRNS